MNYETSNFPQTILEGIRLSAQKRDLKFSDLTIGDAELIIKAWVFESLRELEVPKESEQLFYSKPEACEFLRISMPFLNNLTKDGSIKFKKLGGKVLYLKDDLINSIK